LIRFERCGLKGGLGDAIARYPAVERPQPSPGPQARSTASRPAALADQEVKPLTRDEAAERAPGFHLEIEVGERLSGGVADNDAA
jgi:hypothetical protein